VLSFSASPNCSDGQTAGLRLAIKTMPAGPHPVPGTSIDSLNRYHEEIGLPYIKPAPNDRTLRKGQTLCKNFSTTSMWAGKLISIVFTSVLLVIDDEDLKIFHK
jgi:hypothetical protein